MGMGLRGHRPSPCSATGWLADPEQIVDSGSLFPVCALGTVLPTWEGGCVDNTREHVCESTL